MRDDIDPTNGLVPYYSTNGAGDFRFTGWKDSGSLSAAGPVVASGNQVFGTVNTDSVFAGNSSWTFWNTGKYSLTYTAAGNSGAPANLIALSTQLPNTTSPVVSNVSFGVYVGLRNTNDLCVRNGTVNAVVWDICTPGNVFPTSATWDTFVVTATAAPLGGPPTIKFYVGYNGTMTTYEGASVTCTGTCTATPAVASNLNYWIGYMPTGYGGALGTLGEIGLAVGAVPENTIRSIYNTLKIDWARLGRGVL
jgi:hypothetical protein